MAKAWLRLLSVSFASVKLKKRITFGEQREIGQEDLVLDIVGSKYMSALNDTCKIVIDNLTYSQIVQLIEGEFYDVEVTAGYRDSGARTIFKGGVLWISNKLADNKTHQAIILCASSLVAKYGQKRLNLSFRSGINIYTALSFISKAAGINDANISMKMKVKKLTERLSIDGTVPQWLSELEQTDSSFIVNGDASLDATFSCFASNLTNKRVIKLTSDLVDLTGGFPRLTSDGLSLSIMPTVNLAAGDIIQIDNSIIDISTSSQQDAMKNLGYYLDKDGYYMIYQIDFAFQNHGPDFSINLLCKSKTLVSNYIGG